MLVNAAQHAGPALWQGLMLLALPLWVYVLYNKPESWAKPASVVYVAFGVLLFALIVWANV